MCPVDASTKRVKSRDFLIMASRSESEEETTN
jgi:hypothetical protein